MNRGSKFMILKNLREGDSRWMPPYYDEGAQSNMDYGESRFRDRRGREHYDSGRYAPMRNTMGEGDDMEHRQTYNVGNNYGRIVDLYPGTDTREISGRKIGFERMEGYHYKKQSRMEYGRASGATGGLDERTAKEWTERMHNDDGTSGEHWNMGQVKQLVNQRGIKHSPVEFYAVLNAVYSDYCKVAKKHNVNNMDFYVDMAKAWLDDKDAVPDKAAAYYECIVEH